MQERDSAEVLSVLGLDEKEIQTQKWRDLLKSAVIKSTKNAFYVLLGVENQTDVHYAMPVRNMLYDALNYGKQVNEAKKRHETSKENMSSAEFLSGFKKGDKLTPIIPITLYWGTDEWDAPTHLHEMFGEIDENLLQYIPDYHINLVAPYLIEDFDKFKTELKQSFEFIKYSNDKDHFKEMLSKLKDMKLTNETVSTINLFTGSDIKLNEGEEVTDVCRAIEEIKKEAAEEAVAEMCIAIEEIKKEAAEEAVEEAVAKIKIANVENIMESIHVSVEEACRMLKYSVKDYENAKKKFAI